MENIVEIIGQLVGFVAIAVAFISFQAKKRSSILIIQGIANAIWTVHFLMIGSVAGGVINAFCVVRNLLYAKKDSWRWVNSRITPLVISVCAVAISVTSADHWLDFLLLPSTIVSSIAFYLNDEKKIRAFSIFVSVSWLIFNIIELSISGMCAEIFNLTSIIVAMIRFRKLRYAAMHAELPPSAETTPPAVPEASSALTSEAAPCADKPLDSL